MIRQELTFGAAILTSGLNSNCCSFTLRVHTLSIVYVNFCDCDFACCKLYIDLSSTDLKKLQVLMFVSTSFTRC